MSDIFISYAREDLDRAQKLANALQKEGWSVFWDRTIPAGKTWRDVIGKALAEARCVVVAWSAKSVESPWVIEEADEGREREILVPVLVDVVKPPIGFRNLQAADLIGWDGAETSPSFQRLVADIAGILAPPVKTDAGQVASVQTTEAGTAVVEPEKEAAPAPTPAPPAAKPPAEPPPVSFRSLPMRKVLLWSIMGAIPVGVFVRLWLYQGPSRVPTAVQGGTTEVVAVRVPLKPPRSGTKRSPEVASSPPMVMIPAGEFWMGCNEKVDRQCHNDEKPGGNVYLKAFDIDKYEVTVADYRECAEAGTCSRDGLTLAGGGGYGIKECNWDKPEHEDHPINCVDWYQAKTYCAWAGKRLPTEAEWEKAARGTDGRIYPWGNQWDSSKAKVQGRATTSVGSYSSGVSPYEVHDMVGNVYEWTSTLSKPYPYKGNDGREDSNANGHRVFRGGDLLSAYMFGSRTSDRIRDVPGARRPDLGFRCAKTP